LPGIKEKRDGKRGWKEFQAVRVARGEEKEERPHHFFHRALANETGEEKESG